MSLANVYVWVVIMSVYITHRCDDSVTFILEGGPNYLRGPNTFVEGMSHPDKGPEGHICPTIVTSWWHHCDVIYSIMHLVVQKELLHYGQRATSS